MKFLAKSTDSAACKSGLVYAKGRSSQNKALRKALIDEQYGFCANTEKWLEPLDSVEVEHMEQSIKYHDDCMNWYAALREANLYKKDKQYKGAIFFASRFYQDQQEWNERVEYQRGIDEQCGIYVRKDLEDQEAKDFLDFLGVNDPRLALQRQKRIAFLKDQLQDLDWPIEKLMEWLGKNPEFLSFPTAIEAEFRIDLTPIIQRTA